MISSDALRLAEWYVDATNVISQIATAVEAKRKSPRGRQPNFANLRLLLIGLLLSIQELRSATVDSAWRALQELSLDDQLRLGVVSRDPDTGTITDNISCRTLYWWTDKITECLAFGERWELKLTDAQREQRSRWVNNISRSLLAPFDLGWTSTRYAIDATGLWSWGRSPRLPKEPPPTNTADLDNAIIQANLHPDDDSDDSDSPLDESTEPTSTSPLPTTPHGEPHDTAETIAEEVDSIFRPPSQKSRRRKPPKSVTDPDARTGAKTAKDGSTEWVYGYHVHNLVLLPGPNRPDAEPRVALSYRITPANADIVDVSLDMLTTVTPKCTDVVVDNHYHYKAPERWWDRLHDSHIKQHHGLRSDESGFTEWERVRWAAGWAHCPATPDHLGPLQRPSPTASKAEHERFREQINQRHHYALQRLDYPKRNGSARWGCPALHGTVICHLRPQSIISGVNNGLPMIQHPPNPNDPEGLPPVCQKDSVTITPSPGIRKLMQKHYWGGNNWEKIINQRTYVEGSFGNVKNADTENLHRGQHRLVGIPLVNIIIGLVLASYNMRILRNWHEKTDKGDPNHPLFAPNHTPTYTLRLTEQEVHALTTWPHAPTELDPIRNRLNGDNN